MNGNRGERTEKDHTVLMEYFHFLPHVGILSPEQQSSKICYECKFSDLSKGILIKCLVKISNKNTSTNAKADLMIVLRC